MIDELRTKMETHNFVSIVCVDGHEHTVKAFGEVCGTPFFDCDSETDNQLMYCKQISKGFDFEILVADTVEEAVENDIIDDFDGEYWVK